MAIKKREIRFRNILVLVISFLPILFLLFFAWVWSVLGHRVAFLMHIVVAIILAMGFPALLICQKLDERFDRLEELLGNNHQSEKEEKAIEQDIDKSAKQ